MQNNSVTTSGDLLSACLCKQAQESKDLKDRVRLIKIAKEIKGTK